MKKSKLNDKVLFINFSKPLFLMLNWTFILTFLFCFRVSADSFSQNKMVSLDIQNVKLKKALAILEQKGDVRFLYSEENFSGEDNFTLHVKETPVIEALDILLKQTDLKYRVFENGLIVISSNSTELRDVVVRGQVTDSKGAALQGVVVGLKGTAIRTTTDAQGRFTITTPENGTLVFTYIGYATQEVAVNNRTSINVQLVESTETLSEVVVTALGIERSAKSLTYTTTTVSADELNAVKGPNVLNSLSGGKAPGVFVTQGGNSLGGSPRIIMRGNKSISGSNEPLYVVDGIPTSFSDFNSDDIETLQVLNGSSAAALYGSQAANGVILITTKKGQAGATAVDLTSTATFDSPLIIPDIQTEYGQGLGGVGPSTNPSYRSTNASWGPKITNGSTKYIDDFFQTGQNYINSLSISGGNGPQRVYFSYGNTDSKAMVPNYSYVRNNVTIKGSTVAFRNKVTVGGGINYIKTHSANSPSSGWYNNPMFGLYLFPQGDDMANYAANGGAVWSATRNLWVQNWPYVLNEHSSNENPYWIQNHELSDNWSDRTVFNANAKWDILNWLNLSYRANYSRRNGVTEDRTEATTGFTPTALPNGSYSKGFSNNSDFYNDVLLSASKGLTKTLQLNATAGFVFQNGTDRSMTSSGGGSGPQALAYPNYFSVNAIPAGGSYSESMGKDASYSVLGTAVLGWKQTLFLDVSGRNEWSSTTPQDFFYPSVGLSYVLTETIGDKGVLSFAKLRGSYAEVGNALNRGNAERDPYLSVSNSPNTTGSGPARTINGTPGSLPFFSGTDTINLKPERTKGFEVGADLRLFKNKLTFAVTYYNQSTHDQVFTIGAPSGSGASNFYINGGTIQNTGVEASLSYNTNLRDVKWNMGMGFSANDNRIKSLSTLLTTDRFTLTTGNRLTSLYLLRPGSTLLGGRKYGRYHDLFGRTYVRDASGNLTYNKQGLPVITTSTVGEYVGNANPDFLLNMSNQFSYKNWNLSFLVDGRFGGLTSSSTEQWLDYKGLSQRSADARDAGGVTLPNGSKVDPELYYGYISAKADNGAVADEYLYSTTNIRMREIALGYKLPRFSNTFKSATLTLITRNAFFFYNKAPFDPEIANGTGNAGQGFESFQMPTARSFGLTLRVGF